MLAPKRPAGLAIGTGPAGRQQRAAERVHRVTLQDRVRTAHARLARCRGLLVSVHRFPLGRPQHLCLHRNIEHPGPAAPRSWLVK